LNGQINKNQKSKKEIYYEIILSRIIKCEYKSYDIITEKGLVDEFNVSKSPIREALLELKNNGFLTSIPRFGYQICSFTEKDIEELTKFRMLVEYTSVDFFWQDISEIEALKLKEFVDKNYQDGCKTKTALEYWQLNTQFHLLLISLFRNSYTKKRLAEAMKILGIAYAQAYWTNYHTENIVSDCNCHFEIVNAILYGDKQRALKYLLEDINNFKTLEEQETKGLNV